MFKNTSTVQSSGTKYSAAVASPGIGLKIGSIAGALKIGVVSNKSYCEGCNFSHKLLINKIYVIITIECNINDAFHVRDAKLLN